MMKHGLHKCLLSTSQVFSEEIMNDTLSGKRALVYSLSSTKSFLSSQVKEKGRCGFHLAVSLVHNAPAFMLYNKNFSKIMKEKIDLR
jgi:hypothetical protein